MTTALGQAKDRCKGEAICRDLKQMGLKPVWMEAAADRIAIGFELISAYPNWIKAFHYDATHATPGAFLGMVEEWKAKVRKDVAEGTTSSVVLHMLANHGIGAVDRVIAPAGLH